jgi:uncharacterized protein
VKPFRTSNSQFIYDVGTGKVLECTTAQYGFFIQLVESGDIDEAINRLNRLNNEDLNDIICVIKSENLLQAPFTDNLNIESSKVIDLANHNLEQIIIEVTEACNMACKYCIYSNDNHDFRNFSNKSMDWETAKASIDYGIGHSGDKLAISFYGGEPLIMFELIKKCVEYSQEIRKEKKIIYSMTTNMTLLTNEMVDFFSSIPNYAIVCSIDGNMKLHNRNRVFKDGSPTFINVITNLEKLILAYGDKAKDYISFSMVMTRPLSREDIYNTDTYFSSLEWLPSQILKNVSYVRHSSDVEAHALDTTDKSTYTNPIGRWSMEHIDKKEFMYNEFTDDLLVGHLKRVHNRILTDKPYPNYALNGCCMPASRKIYITVDGEFKVCERMGKSPTIGNIHTGLITDKLIDKFIETYWRLSKSKCLGCWAIRMCPVCYSECFSGENFDEKHKEIACNRTRSMLEQDLIDYHEIMSINPELLSKLN